MPQGSRPFAFSDICEWYEASCVIRSFTIRWWLLPCLSTYVTEIETHLNNNFSNLCEWFLDNKLSIYFGEDKTKSILFGTKRKSRKASKLSITYQIINIKQNSQITYLGCIFDEKMTGEPMAYKTIKKINSRLNYLFRKKQFLTPRLRRLLCNALIQPHFDYGYTTWYPNLN